MSDAKTTTIEVVMVWLVIPFIIGYLTGGSSVDQGLAMILWVTCLAICTFVPFVGFPFFHLVGHPFLLEQFSFANMDDVFAIYLFVFALFAILYNGVLLVGIYLSVSDY